MHIVPRAAKMLHKCTKVFILFLLLYLPFLVSKDFQMFYFTFNCSLIGVKRRKAAATWRFKTWQLGLLCSSKYQEQVTTCRRYVWMQGRRFWRHMTSLSHAVKSRPWHHNHVTRSATLNNFRVRRTSSSAVTSLITWSRGQLGANQRHIWHVVGTPWRHGWHHLINITTNYMHSDFNTNNCNCSCINSFKVNVVGFFVFMHLWRDGMTSEGRVRGHATVTYKPLWKGRR